MNQIAPHQILYFIGIAGFVIFVFSGFRIVRPIERGLVERFGKYKRFATPGLNWIIPVFEHMFKVDVTENMVDAAAQEIITKDNLNAQVDAQLYYKVKIDEESVKASQYNVSNYEIQIVSLTRTTLRNIVGTLSLKEANVERNRINKDLMETLKKEVSNWGLEVVRAELKEIQPPKDVQTTMNQVVKAENEKIAAIDFATAKETEADGIKRAEIKKAEGEAKAIVIKAEAGALSIRLLNEAAEKYFVGNTQKLKAYEVTESSLKNNTKILITEKGIQPTIVLGLGSEGDQHILPVKQQR